MGSCGFSSYFRSNWNRLDAFVVVISLVAIALPQVKIFRSFRALRPLRIIVRSKKIQVSVVITICLTLDCPRASCVPVV